MSSINNLKSEAQKFYEWCDVEKDLYLEPPERYFKIWELKRNLASDDPLEVTAKVTILKPKNPGYFTAYSSDDFAHKLRMFGCDVPASLDERIMQDRNLRISKDE